MSASNNLVPGDTNGDTDVFVHDLSSGVTRRVSVDSSGAQANGKSGSPSMSPDGQFVAFESAADNLVANDTNDASDIFVYDLEAGVTKRRSLSASNGQADDGSFYPSLAAGALFVAFASDATNLVAGDTNGEGDVFVRGNELVLEIEPGILYPFDPIQIDIWEGLLNDPVLLLLTEINGTPVSHVITLGHFDRRGIFTLRGLVTLEGIGMAPSGKIVKTNDVEVSFQ
jgi:hypothetical protein